MATVEQILNADIPKPSWAWRPSSPSPLGEGVTFQRSTPKWGLSPQQRFVKSLAGESVIGGPRTGLIRAPQFTQVQPDYASLNGPNWTERGVTVNEDAGNALGKPYDEVREEAISSKHRLDNAGYNSTDGARLSAVLVARPAGREWVRLMNSFRQSSDGSNLGSAVVDLNLATGEVRNKIASDSTILGAGVYEYVDNWVAAVLDININSGVYSYVNWVQLLKSAGNESYLGDTSKGIDVLVSNVQDGAATSAPPAFATGTINQDQPEFTIPNEDFNYNRGTYFFKGVPRFFQADRFPRIAEFAQLDWFFSNANPLEIQALEGAGAGNEFIISPTGNLTPHEPLRAALTYSEGGDWALSVNGDYVEKSNHNGGMLGRPNPGFLYSSSQGTLEYNSFKYIPSRLSKLQMQTLTSI